MACSTFTFSHVADAFVQSDLHMCELQCIHILHFTFTLMAHCTFSVLLKDASTVTRTSTLLITKRLLCHCNTVAHIYIYTILKAHIQQVPTMSALPVVQERP